MKVLDIEDSLKNLQKGGFPDGMINSTEFNQRSKFNSLNHTNTVIKY